MKFVIVAFLLAISASPVRAEKTFSVYQCKRVRYGSEIIPLGYRFEWVRMGKTPYESDAKSITLKCTEQSTFKTRCTSVFDPKEGKYVPCGYGSLDQYAVTR